MSNASFNCQRCASQNTSSFAMLYENGTNVQAQTQSILAEKVAPPAKPVILLGEFLTALIGSFGIVAALVYLSADYLEKTTRYRIGLPLFIIIATVYIIFRRRQIKEKVEIWDEEMRHWRRSWMCLKCGYVWFNPKQK
jgi:hypothetical protein